MQTNLMGIDVGFSKTGRTTEIACLYNDRLTLWRTGTPWECRKAKTPYGFQPSVIAIDGPLLRLGADLHMSRHVEPLFICAPFHVTVGDPALVVIMAWDWIASGIHSNCPQRTGFRFLFVHVAWHLRPIAVFDPESLLLSLDKLLRLVRRHSR